ncbi:hypothetical protein ASPCAL12866 [Aspergillus calidoustus]|uniref:Cellobiose dehydrogenase-like cytochrome domain-containing protein n=1 Tax=Aspergillus calidoustus TaxID=454130 RepID=A0A0U5GG51_ASPCI|nr:hypothetical protein ASPCAL12866 [Aspergillus calidoustus]
MADANMFLVYASASNPHNITISPRTATGHVPPLYNHHTHISLLPTSSSGIDNGIITAEIECHTCLEGYGGSMDPSSTSTHWVWAFRERPASGDGGSLRSDDVTAAIHFHDSFGRVTVDLSRARTGHSSSPGDGGGYQDPFTDPDFRAVRPADGTASSGGSIHSSLVTAHAVLMSLTFLVFFPLFALSVPLGYPLLKVHAPLQASTVLSTLIGAGIGLYIWLSWGIPPSAAPHPILGLALISLLTFILPTLGYLQHLHFVRVGRKGIYAYAHRWLARLVILVGVGNGVVGLLWAGAERRLVGWYVAFATLVLLVYVGIKRRIARGVEGRRKDSIERIEDPYRDLDVDNVEVEGGDGDADGQR